MAKKQNDISGSCIYFSVQLTDNRQVRQYDISKSQPESPNLVLNGRKFVLNEPTVRFKRKKTRFKRNDGSFKTSF